MPLLLLREVNLIQPLVWAEDLEEDRLVGVVEVVGERGRGEIGRSLTAFVYWMEYWTELTEQAQRLVIK